MPARLPAIERPLFQTIQSFGHSIASKIIRVVGIVRSSPEFFIPWTLFLSNSSIYTKLRFHEVIIRRLNVGEKKKKYLEENRNMIFIRCDLIISLITNYSTVYIYRYSYRKARKDRKYFKFTIYWLRVKAYIKTIKLIPLLISISMDKVAHQVEERRTNALLIRPIGAKKLSSSVG